MNKLILKNARDTVFEESRFPRGDRDFREMSHNVPTQYSKEDMIRCLGNCSVHGWIVDGHVLSTRLTEIGNQFSTSELLQLFVTCIDGAGGAMIPNNTRVAANFLEVASAAIRLILQRTDISLTSLASEIKLSLDDLYENANDAAVENRSCPELSLACLAISGWAIDLERGISGDGPRNIPEGAPTYYSF